MKNIITVTRLNDKARRIYELPEDVTLRPGTIVELENRFDNLTIGVTLSNSALLDDNAVAVIRNALNLDVNGNFLRVRAVFGESKALYPEYSEPEDGCGLDPDEDEAGEDE